LSLRVAVKVLTALVAAGVLAVAAIAFIGISIDAQRWREPVAAALSGALGREVQLGGPARLTLSLHPALVVRDLRIANPPGFDPPDFARIGELRVAMALLPLLLRDEIRLHELRGRDVTVRLARIGDGPGNWSFAGGAQDGASRSSRLGVDRLALENVLIEYAGPGAARRVVLAELTAEAPPDQPVRLVARGRGDAFALRVAGAPLSGLGASQPWPFDAQLSSPGAALNANGMVSGPLDRPTVRAAFGAGAGDLGEVGRLLNLASPSGAGAIAAELEAGPSRAALTSINAVIGGIPVAGELALETRGPRPKLTGRLAVSTLDLRAPPGRAPAGEGRTADTLAAAFGELERTELDLTRLVLADADLRLNVAHWAGLPGDVRDVSASLRIDAGKLAAPVAATVGGARFEGELSADGTSTPPRLRAQLAARDAPLGGLAELVFDAPYVVGSARRFEAALDAAGSRVGDLARDLEARIRIEGAALTYGNYAGGRPVAMRLDAAEVAQPRGRTIAGKLRGSLRGKPFDGTFRAGTVERILRERRTPFAFDGASGGVRARLSGTLAEPSAASGPEIVLDVTAPRARELAPWLGFSSASDARVALKGTVKVLEQLTSFTGGTLVVGRTSVAGDVTWRQVAGKALVTADVVAEVLAPAELRELAGPITAPRRATLLEVPILPESLDFADSDVALRVKRVDGLPVEIAEVHFKGRMRGGAVTPSPFSLRVEGNALAGALALDARGEIPAAALWAAGHDVDLGPLLRRLRVARDVESRLGAVRLYADIRERRLGDALERSSFVAEFESGTLDFRDANTRSVLRIAVARGEVRADAGAPMTASLTGTAGTAPVTLKAQTGSLRALAEPSARLPFSLTAETPAAKLAIGGTAVPQRQPDVALRLALTGERLDGLDELLESSLPPWGPYALTGQLRLSKRGYEVEAMRLALGGSVLTGKGTLDTTAAPPKFDVSLAAERIRLDDFPLGDWSPFEARSAGGVPLTVETARQAVREGARRAHAIFSQELLGRLAGDVDLVVTRAVAGEREIGRGRFRARVEKGRATIGPVEIEGRAGGRVAGTLAYEPRSRDVVVEARLQIDRFDYGLLMRTLRPHSDFDGVLSLDLRLDATAPQLSAALATGSGHFDFTVWPERFTGGAFDLWAANLLFRLLPVIDVTASPMNCFAGQFDLVQGRLESQRIVIDTVNVRTEGSGWADFGSSELHLRFVPRPKVPQFFSLATPVEVNGTFEDYRFGVRRVDALGTAARWVASPVVVPIQRLVGERIPRDGRDVCQNPRR
jgi:uncharacterized protein involved in outer membrane biogenesis